MIKEHSRILKMLEPRNMEPTENKKIQKQVENNKKKMLIEANINLGKGKSDKLILFDGMLIEDQINEFALKNSIF